MDYTNDDIYAEDVKDDPSSAVPLEDGAGDDLIDTEDRGGADEEDGEDDRY